MKIYDLRNQIRHRNPCLLQNLHHPCQIHRHRQIHRRQKTHLFKDIDIFLISFCFGLKKSILETLENEARTLCCIKYQEILEGNCGVLKYVLQKTNESLKWVK